MERQATYSSMSWFSALPDPQKIEGTEVGNVVRDDLRNPEYDGPMGIFTEYDDDESDSAY